MHPSGPAGVPGESPGPVCRCGHGRRAHVHYRKGTDCALCACPRFHRGLLRRLLGARRWSPSVRWPVRRTDDPDREPDADQG
jgi:hypothetical protein